MKAHQQTICCKIGKFVAKLEFKNDTFDFDRESISEIVSTEDRISGTFIIFGKSTIVIDDRRHIDTTLGSIFSLLLENFKRGGKSDRLHCSLELILYFLVSLHCNMKGHRQVSAIRLQYDNHHKQTLYVFLKLSYQNKNGDAHSPPSPPKATSLYLVNCLKRRSGKLGDCCLVSERRLIKRYELIIGAPYSEILRNIMFLS